MRIYVASSWRNKYQPEVVQALRKAGHEVYDFRNPSPGDKGFAWSDIDPNWQAWTPEEFRAALSHPVARKGFESDFNAMRWADMIVMVLPCGRSAHLEAGWGTGVGWVSRTKRVVALILEPVEPELMYLQLDAIYTSIPELLEDHS